jgi:plastocyanin
MLHQARRSTFRSSAWMAPIGAAVALLAMAAWLIAAPRVDAAETVTVDITNFTFDPGTVTIQVGDTVTWTNNDAMPHTATSTDDPATFDGEMQPGESFSFTFEEEGTFAYFCEIHPQMEGTIVVEAAEIPDGAMSNGEQATPAVPLGIALILLSLLAGIAVARRRAATAA